MLGTAMSASPIQDTCATQAPLALAHEPRGRGCPATMACRGALAEWLGTGLQNLVHRFDSGRRLSQPYLHTLRDRCLGMCIRCHGESINELCAYCVTLTRIESERGFVRLEAYLRKWAAFERWLERHAPASVT
jgi:hypothetical protein